MAAAKTAEAHATEAAIKAAEVLAMSEQRSRATVEAPEEAAAVQAVTDMVAANLRSRAAFSKTMPCAPGETEAATHLEDEGAEGGDGGPSDGPVDRTGQALRVAPVTIEDITGLLLLAQVIANIEGADTSPGVAPSPEEEASDYRTHLVPTISRHPQPARFRPGPHAGQRCL